MGKGKNIYNMYEIYRNVYRKCIENVQTNIQKMYKLMYKKDIETHLDNTYTMYKQYTEIYGKTDIYT